MSTFNNPILPGFYPDPSICRVEGDYYLVTSSFVYYPGIPIFHSRDLVHWEQIGHVLDRPSQLNLNNLTSPYEGIYAATIRHHQGIFYVVTTNVGNDGNFIVTATDPAGDWSDPYWLPDAPGIDPSLFFDDDGRAWYTGNRIPQAGEFNGHREIWLQELDITSMRFIGERYTLWDGANRHAVHSEAPHIYKVNGTYYLLTAEGGTFHDHAVVIARSKSITGPYENNPRNPILTHRHLGLNYPITNTGHAELIQTQNNDWWMVALASRPVGGYFYNLGRETFLAPVIWEDDFPVVSPGTGCIAPTYANPKLPTRYIPGVSACDHFETEELTYIWNTVYTPASENYFELNSGLHLKLQPTTISEMRHCSFIGRRQQHHKFVAVTKIRFSPQMQAEEVGIVLLQTKDFHFRFTYHGDGSLQLIRRENGEDELIRQANIPPDIVYLKVAADEQDYHFFYALEPEKWHELATDVDGRTLSTQRAGGFTGAYIGMYASSNGDPSDNVAHFHWFAYEH